MESDITFKLKSTENCGDLFYKELAAVFSICFFMYSQWEIVLQWHTAGMEFGDILY
jgi:hypothetical protein